MQPVSESPRLLKGTEKPWHVKRADANRVARVVAARDDATPVGKATSAEAGRAERAARRAADVRVAGTAAAPAHARATSGVRVGVVRDVATAPKRARGVAPRDAPTRATRAARATVARAVGAPGDEAADRRGGRRWRRRKAGAGPTVTRTATRDITPTCMSRRIRDAAIGPQTRVPPCSSSRMS